jgi:hypothetical protein
MCARVCPECLTPRRQRDCRTRTIQTLSGTVKVDAHRINVCPCSNERGFVDLSFSPLARLLPDRCTPELRRVQAELGARHSFREAAQLLSTLLPCSPTNHATICNRTHRVAVEIEAKAPRVTLRYVRKSVTRSGGAGIWHRPRRFPFADAGQVPPMPLRICAF